MHLVHQTHGLLEHHAVKLRHHLAASKVAQVAPLALGGALAVGRRQLGERGLEVVGVVELHQQRVALRLRVDQNVAGARVGRLGEGDVAGQQHSGQQRQQQRQQAMAPSSHDARDLVTEAQGGAK